VLKHDGYTIAVSAMNLMSSSDLNNAFKSYVYYSEPEWFIKSTVLKYKNHLSEKANEQRTYIKSRRLFAMVQ
jgi:hypothetical protein